MSLPICTTGSFTDRIGRRIGLILPTVSAILRCLVFTLPQMTSSLPLEFTYLGSLLDGLTGSDVIMVGTCYAYLSDVTSVERRSFRILLAELVQNAFKGVIHLGTGYAIAALGFLYPYLILMAFHIVNLVYIVFFVPETRIKVPNQQIISKQLIIQPFRVSFLLYVFLSRINSTTDLYSCFYIIFSILYGLIKVIFMM